MDQLIYQYKHWLMVFISDVRYCDLQSVISLHHISIWNKYMFFLPILELLQLLIFDENKIWVMFLTKSSGVYIARKVAFSSIELEDVKWCLTLVQLLNTRMQLLGDVWTKLSPRCITPVGDVNGSMPTDPGGTKHLFNTYFWILNEVKQDLTLAKWWQERSELRYLWNSVYLICQTHSSGKPII